MNTTSNMKNKLFKTVLKEVCDCYKESVTLNEEDTEQTYTVTFYVRSNDEKKDYDWDVKATSTQDAIEKVQSGKVKGPYGEDLPTLARNLTAELK